MNFFRKGNNAGLHLKWQQSTRVGFRSMDIAGKRGLAGTTSASDGESISAEIETDFNNFSFNWGLLFTSLWVVISSKFNLNRLKMILCILTALNF